MILPDAGTWLLLALLGGVTALDATSLGQFMLSRPLVAAALAGWVVGAPAQGIAVGVVLEALHLGVLPVGAARYPEPGPPAVAAASVWALSPRSGEMLLLALLFALFWEWLCGSSVQRLRQFNTRFSVGETVMEVDTATLERRHLLALGADFARGVVLAAVGIALLGAAAGLLPASEGPGRIGPLVAGAVAAAALAAALRSFGMRRAPLFLAGAACGAVLLVLT